MKVEEIDWIPTLIRLGVDSSFLNGKHGPCLFCGGKDRWRFTNYQGKGVFICNQCTPEGGNGAEIVMRLFGCSYGEAMDEIKEKAVVAPKTNGKAIKEKEFKENREKFLSIYKSLKPGRDTPAEKYLRSRKITFPTPFKYHQSESKIITLGCFWIDSYLQGFGAMAWKVIDYLSGGITQLHLTVLTEEGKKAPLQQPKLYTKSIMELPKESHRFAPLVLSDPKRIVLTEGIETGLSVHEIFKIIDAGIVPPTIIACLDAGMLSRFRPAPGLPADAEYMICADNDQSETGINSAKACHARIISEPGFRGTANIYMPSETGEDWADVLESSNEEKMMQLAFPIN